MISTSLAEKLKQAGLVWEPQEGDWYSHLGNKPDVFVNALIGFKSDTVTEYLKIYDDEFPDGRLTTLKEMLLEKSVWLPRLDQLLAEIEKRGYLYLMGNYKIWDSDKPCFIEVWREEDVMKEDGGIGEKEFYSDTPEEAAGQALLFVIEQEGKE